MSRECRDLYGGYNLCKLVAQPTFAAACKTAVFAVFQNGAKNICLMLAYQLCTFDINA